MEIKKNKDLESKQILYIWLLKDYNLNIMILQ